MTRPVRRLLTLVTAVGIAVGTAPPARGGGPAVPPDTGKKRLAALFAPSLKTAAASVARVQRDGKDAALGTVVTADGYLLTKGSELRGELTVVLKDGTVHDATRVGYHKPSDLALLKIDAAKLTPVAFAEDDGGAVGDWVAAPGLATDPLAVGVVSVAARKLYGEQTRIENGNKGFLGIVMAAAEDNAGIVIKAVTPRSAAYRAGMKAGDVIRQLDGKPVDTPDALTNNLDGFLPGDKVSLLVKRGEKEITLAVKLGDRSEYDRSMMQNNMGGEMSGRRTGFPAVLQHDTVLKPTDCGGPLVDLDGRVLGLNIARAGRVETWTLPASVVQPVLKDLLAGKYPEAK